MPWIVLMSLEPFTEWVPVRTDTTLNQDWRTEQLRMNVQRALSCHCRQQMWISTLLLSRGLHRLMQDSWAQRGRDIRRVQEARLLTDSYQTIHCVNSPNSCTNTSWSWKKKKNVCSLCHHRVSMGSKSYRQLWNQSVFTKSRATSCHCNCCHDPLMTHPSRWSRPTLTTRASLRVSMFTLGILFVHNGVATHHQIHHRLRQHSYTNPANLQCCCCIIAEPDIVQTSVQIAVNTLLILGEVPVLDSFLHPAVPRVDVFRSLSCSQSIRQRIRCRTVTLYFNLHWTSQEHRSQWSSNLTSFHRWVKLRLSNAQCCQALTRRSRLHSVVTDLSHHSRRALPPRLGRQQSRCPRRLWSCQLFLSSKSQRCCGLSHQIPRCTFQRVKVEFQRLALSLDQMLRCFSKIQSVLCQVWKSFPSKSVSCCFIFLQNRTPSSVWTSVWSSV